MVLDIDESIRKEGNRRRFSPKTIKTYQNCVKKFLLFSGKTVDKISKKDAREFLSYLANERKVAGSTLHVNHMAIRFFLEDVLNKKMRLNIKYSKNPRKFPIALNKKEIKCLLESIENWKHRLMIELMYGAGLRVSELINLRVGDLRLEEGYGFVRNGKGGKDRLFIIDPIIKDKIIKLINEENTEEDSSLFKSNRNKKYNVASLRKIIKRAGKKAGINKNISCHTLRHSFATHLIENGYDVSAVQAMLGHKSPETSMIYIHMASPNMINIKSPIGEIYKE
jgi:site-specific recombinase XerD